MVVITTIYCVASITLQNNYVNDYILTLSSKSPASSSGGMDLLVSVGVQAPTEIPRSGNKVMSK
jgi:hypothetical protein